MKKRKPTFPSKDIIPRYVAIVVFCAIAGLVILGKAAYIMFVEHDYWLTVSAKYESNYKVLPATRGNILAADGQVLATSLPEYRIYLDPMTWERDSLRAIKDQHFRDSILTHCLDSIVVGMHRIVPGIEPDKVRRRILEGRKKKSHNISLYNRRITYIQLTELKKLPLFRLSSARGGFYTEEFRRRKNPFGTHHRHPAFGQRLGPEWFGVGFRQGAERRPGHLPPPEGVESLSQRDRYDGH